MLSHSPCQNKDPMIQVFTQSDRRIICIPSDTLHTYMRAYIDIPSCGANKWWAASEQGASISALWSVETFSCWVTAECGNWPCGGFSVRRTQTKAQKHSALCVCASMLDLRALVDIYSVPSCTTQTGCSRGRWCAAMVFVYIFTVLLSFDEKESFS